jgi:apolipoprotein N-acyltransferase
LGCSSIERMAGSVLLVTSLVVSGCVIGAATGSTGLSWLAWIALLPLFFTIRIASPPVALLYGGLWGLCLYLFSAATDSSAITTTIRSLGLLAAIPAVYAYLGARLTRTVGYAPMLLALGWIVVEFALQPLALRQGLLAGTQGDGTLVRIAGGLLGYLFVAFLIAFINAKLTSLVAHLAPTITRLHFSLPEQVICGWIIPHVDSRFASHILTILQPRAPPLRLA